MRRKMKTYYGTKRILATPMTKAGYNAYVGQESAEGDIDVNGYIVEYTNGGPSNHESHDGYISWSPADVFESSYQSTHSLNFGHALAAMREGHKVARAEWNDENMWLVLVEGAPDVESKSYPHIDMMTADGTMQPGWLASQADLLAQDWHIVE